MHRISFALDPVVQKLIAERVASGKYLCAEDVVAAAIVALDQQEQIGDFAVGEVDDLLAEGERSIRTEGTLDGDEAFRMRRERRACDSRQSQR
jgi:Arc/MetJ-type ribon-helix-helix transcriptional regulator